VLCKNKSYYKLQSGQNLEIKPPDWRNTGKGKAIPLQALTGPEGSRRLKLPDIKTIGT
jgi:hypothetical protein